MTCLKIKNINFFDILLFSIEDIIYLHTYSNIIISFGPFVFSRIFPVQYCVVADANGLNFIILRIRPLVIYVRPHLEFAVQAWSPWQRGEVDLLEAVHMRTSSENWVWRPLNNVDWTRI